MVGIGLSVDIVDNIWIKIVFVGDGDENNYLFGCFFNVIIV